MNAYTHLHLADTAGAVEALRGIEPGRPATSRQLLSGAES